MMVDSRQEQEKGQQPVTPSEGQRQDQPAGRTEEREHRPAIPSEEQKPEVTPSAGWRPEDVLLDIPQLGVDAIELEVLDLRAHVSLVAEVLNLVKLNVGVDATLGKVGLDIRGVRAQALLQHRQGVGQHLVETLEQRALVHAVRLDVAGALEAAAQGQRHQHHDAVQADAGEGAVAQGAGGGAVHGGGCRKWEWGQFPSSLVDGITKFVAFNYRRN